MRRALLVSVVALCAAFARPHDLPQADLAVVQSAPMATASNESFTITLTVTNGGPDDAPSVHIDGGLPGGASFVSASSANLSCAGSGSSYSCSAGALPSGASFTVDVTATAPPLATQMTLVSSATVSIPGSAGTDGNGTNDAAMSSITIVPVDLGIAKVALGGPASTGGALDYALTVTNGATVPAHGVVVTDALPAGTTFVSASGSGWSCVVANATLSCTRPTIASSAMSTPTVNVVLMAPSSSGTVVNTASVSAIATDPKTTNNAASAMTTVAAPPAGSADLSLAVTGPAQVDVGTPLVYTVAVANAGPDAAASVQVLGTLPSDATFVSANGAGWSCTQATTTVTCTPSDVLPNGMAAPITVTLTAPLTAGSVSASFVVTASTTDPNLADDTASASTLVLDPAHANQAPTLAVDGLLVTLEDTPVAIGGTVVIGDPDSAADDVELDVVGTECVFSLGTTTGLTFLVGDGVLDPELHVRGPIATLALALASGTVTPFRDHDGTATLALHLDDLGHTGTGGSLTADGMLEIVVLPVDDLPIAAPDDVTVNANVTTQIDVLANDSIGQAGQVLSIATVTQPAHGTAKIENGYVLYTPTLYYTGDDAFSYALTDGTVFATGSVTVHVQPFVPPTPDRLGGGCSTTGRADVSFIALLFAYWMIPRRRNHSTCSRSAAKTGVGA